VGPDPPWEGAILGERDAHCKVQGLSAMSCAEVAELIDLSFGFGWAQGSTCSVVFTMWRQCAQVQSYSPVVDQFAIWVVIEGSTVQSYLPGELSPQSEVAMRPSLTSISVL